MSRTFVVVAAIVGMLFGASVAPPARAVAPTTATVTGVVRDADGTPLPGVSVVAQSEVKGAGGGFTARSTFGATDAEGRYVLRGAEVPGPDVGDGVLTHLMASANGFASATFTDYARAMRAAAGGTLDADLVLRRRDVTLSGRIAVRDGGTSERGTVTANVTGLDVPDFGAEGIRWFTTEVDADGGWRLDVPAGSYRLEAESRYGLPTRLPDLPMIRRDDPVITVAAGDRRDGLDFSLRHRLPEVAFSEFGDDFAGYDPSNPDGSNPSGTIGRYPRDTYRSVLTVVGPRVRAGSPRMSPIPGLSVPDGQLITLTGGPFGVDVAITNTGDDILWTGTARFEGPDGGPFSCIGCSNIYLLPGETRTVAVSPQTTVYKPTYHATLVIPTNAPGPDVRVALSLRNVSDPSAPPSDPLFPSGLLPYVPSSVLAFVLAHPEQVRPPDRATTTPSASRTVGRVALTPSRVRVAFPATGSATVTVARRTVHRARAHRRPASSWRTVRRLRLRTARGTTRTARIHRLSAGRYRVRVRATIMRQAARTTTTYRTIHRH